MGNDLFYALPDNTDVRKKIVESVPADWQWLDGILHFPPDLLEFRDIAHNTGYVFSRQHGIAPTIVGKSIRGTGQRHKPNLPAIMVDRKLPSFIAFDEAGFGGGEQLEAIRGIASEFVRRGYVGWLTFIRSCHKNNKYDNSARCELRINSHGDVPSEIKLFFGVKFGGHPSNLAPILTACHSAGLRPLQQVVALRDS